MSNTAIQIENIGKRYRIGASQDERLTTLRETLTRGLKSIFSPSSRGASTEEEFWALKGVSLEVNVGDRVGIVGRNGAGKTTLLKILSRITEPTEGRIRIRGRVASLLEVGTGFHPDLTGRENIFLNGAILGMSRGEIRQKFDAIVSFAEVEKFIDTPVKRYSSGMYVRLAFSVAAHLEPEILLVDEVLAVGDAAFQKKCLGKMSDLTQQGRTILFVSHNLAAVKAFCRSAVFLEDGHNVFEGPVEQVVDRYLGASTGEGSSGLLAPRRHNILGDSIEIRQISVTNREGHATGEIRMGEPMTVKIEFAMKNPGKDIRLGVGINTLDGVRIATLHHTDGGQPLFGAENGLYEISFNLTNPLLAGTYVLSVGAHRALGGLTLDYVPDALRFHVAEVAVADEPPAYNNGMIRIEGTWASPRRIQ